MTKIIVNYNDAPETGRDEKPIFTVIPDLTYLARVNMPAVQGARPPEDLPPEGILITVDEGKAMIRALRKALRIQGFRA